MTTTKTIAVCNQKGGVGKSTTTFHLARAAVRSGRRVLVVDDDPQGDLTAVLTAETITGEHAGLADVLSSRAEEKAADVLVAGIWDGLDVLPTAGPNLSSVRDELVIAGAGRESRLATALQALAANYDLILIDCAPSLDQLTINGLVAADEALVVTQSKLWSANGLAELLETISTVRQHYAPGLTVAGVLVNQHEGQTVSGGHWLDELRTAAAGRELRLLEPVVPKRVVIADAVESSHGLDQWPGGEARSLAELYDTHLQTLLQDAETT